MLKDLAAKGRSKFGLRHSILMSKSVNLFQDKTQMSNTEFRMSNDEVKA